MGNIRMDIREIRLPKVYHLVEAHAAGGEACKLWLLI
jgi:hypothetical protein